MAHLLEKIGNSKLVQGARALIFNTKIEILAGLIAVGTMAGMMSYRENKKDEAHQPLAFSEYESIVESFNKRGQKVPGMTVEYAVSNDLVMKVFEASNDALAKDEKNETFARELEKHNTRGETDHALISDYAQQFPQITREALQTMKAPIEATRDLPPLVNAFDRAWDDSHYDHYRTEVYPVTVCNSNGKTTSCHTELRTRQVYDHTTHTYTFNAAEAQRAVELLDAFLQKHPELDLGRQIARATETHEANNNAILKSMYKKFKDRKPDAAELLKIANTWADAANFNKYYPDVVSSHRKFQKLSPAWKGALWTAKSTSYNTYSHSDAGPEEFQIAEAAIKYGVAIGSGTKNITEGIVFAGQKVPELDAAIKEYVDVTLHGKKGDADELREKIMETSRQIYEKNFKDGFDVYPFSWGMIILLTLAGAAVGAALGAGADKLLDKYEEKRLSREEERRRSANKRWYEK